MSSVSPHVGMGLCVESLVAWKVSQKGHPPGMGAGDEGIELFRGQGDGGMRIRVQVRENLGQYLIGEIFKSNGGIRQSIRTLDYLETKSFLWSWRSHGILILGNPLTSSSETAGWGRSQTQSAKLLVEPISVDVMDRVVSRGSCRDRVRL